MTAPPFRLVFIYQNTDDDCAMRQFMVSTAAFRVLRQGSLSGVMKDLVGSGGQLAIDLAEALANMHRDGLPDPRRGPDTLWHRPRSE